MLAHRHTPSLARLNRGLSQRPAQNWATSRSRAVYPLHPAAEHTTLDFSPSMLGRGGGLIIGYFEGRLADILKSSILSSISQI